MVIQLELSYFEKCVELTLKMTYNCVSAILFILLKDATQAFVRSVENYDNYHYYLCRLRQFFIKLTLH